MNLPLPVVFILFSFLLPGFVALFFYSRYYDRALPRDLNWGYGTVLAVFFAALIHFVMLSLTSQIRPVDFVSVLYLATGHVTDGGADRINEAIHDCWGCIGLYSLATLVLGGPVGIGSGKLAAKYVPPNQSDKLFVSEDRVWTVIDLLVESSKLYRGVYHSHRFPGEDHEGYLCLFLVSKWSGNKPSKEGEGGFVAVRRTIGAQEVLKMIRDDYAQTKPRENADEWLQKELDALKTTDELDNWVDGYLTKSKQEVPQMSFPWPRIRNINVRQFET